MPRPPIARSCLVLSHVAFENLGSLRRILPDYGFEIRFCEMGVEDGPVEAIIASDLLVVLGGPIGVYETEDYPFLTAEIVAIGARLRAQKPTLGICLGAQLMAAALSAPVGPGDAKEIGYAPLTLTDAGRASPLAALEGVPVLHWHGDAFGLPEGASLASTEICPHQAFALDKFALALQFHAEVEPLALEAWLIGHTVELAKFGLKPGVLRAQAARYGAATVAAGEKMFRTWLDGVFA